MKKKIAVFASGSGSNAENIAVYFEHSEVASVALIVTVSVMAGVVERATRLDIPVDIITKKEFQDEALILKKLAEMEIDFIVLAGFLWLVPGYLLKAYEKKIINIHPALLPFHGGKGFYGQRVHDAVIASESSISGITIHYVNEHFDEGEIIFQAACYVDPGEDAATLAKKIHALEHKYFPVVIEKLLRESK